ncbi:hypothetical protein H5410_014699 [Solanum commersonii]|uniref:Uncharacterized protein n=1 Tax=Solanum commersonii TaxID=4109 RepID=A0A9J5ZRZ4_SOLCO|nr:hypothetical protein H5410_014699 [Solanum commersonii]
MEHSMSSEEEIGDEEKQLKNTSFDLKDYTIIKEGEAEILMHATNQAFYNKTQHTVASGCEEHLIDLYTVTYSGSLYLVLLGLIRFSGGAWESVEDLKQINDPLDFPIIESSPEYEIPTLRVP